MKRGSVEDKKVEPDAAYWRTVPCDSGCDHTVTRKYLDSGAMSAIPSEALPGNIDVAKRYLMSHCSQCGRTRYTLAPEVQTPEITVPASVEALDSAFWLSTLCDSPDGHILTHKRLNANDAGNMPEVILPDTVIPTDYLMARCDRCARLHFTPLPRTLMFTAGALFCGFVESCICFFEALAGNHPRRI
jgi:hypothetical protein